MNATSTSELFVFRPITALDNDALLALAYQTGSGMTTLKADAPALASRVALAERSFAGLEPLSRADFLFVLEECGSGRVVGVSALKAAVGLEQPFYNYRLGRLVHGSSELGVYTNKQTLYLTNDYTGCAELCTLFLDAAFRHGNNGRLLSKGRLLYAATIAAQLPEKIVAELRGFQDGQGDSPVWESLGRHFFHMDFDRADDISGTRSKSFIAELMPRYPVYTDFLTPAARDALGVVHPSTAPARRLLESEGFHYEGYVDIFDGGPVLEARIRELRLVRDSHQLRVTAAEQAPASPQPEAAHRDAMVDTPADHPGQWLLVANTDPRQFRALAMQGEVQAGTLALEPATLAALRVAPGQSVRVATLHPQEMLHG